MKIQLDQIASVRALAKACAIPVRRIITHENPSIDDAVAIAVLFFEGTDLFSDIQNSTIELVPRKQLEIMLAQYNGDTIRFLVEDGSLIVGMGGSFLDEHEHERNGHVRAAGECAATLAARLVDVREDRYWKPILDYAYQDDTGTRNDWRYLDCDKTLPNLIKASYAVDPNNVDWSFGAAINFVKSYHLAMQSGEVRISDKPNWHIDRLIELADADWAEEAGKDFYKVYKQNEAAKAELAKRLKSITPKSFGAYGNRNLSYITVTGDEPNLPKVVFKQCKSLVMVIVRRSNNQTQIFTRNGSNIPLGNTVGILRQMEAVAENRKIEDINDWYKPGDLPGCGKWYYFKSEKGNEMILNGSLTSVDTPPTLLRLCDIEKALVVGLKNAPRQAELNSNSTNA